MIFKTYLSVMVSLLIYFMAMILFGCETDYRCRVQGHWGSRTSPFFESYCEDAR